MHLHTLLYNKCSTLAITAIGLLLATACSHVSRNGLIDGRWRLHEIHSKVTPTDAYYTAQKKYVLNDRIYWSFQLDLLQITSSLAHNGQTNKTFARFNYESDKLAVYSPYAHLYDHDIPITDPNISLESVGIRGHEANFRIVRINSSSLILCSDMDSLVFRKLH